MSFATCSACGKAEVDPELRGNLCGDCLTSAEEAVDLDESVRHE